MPISRYASFLGAAKETTVGTAVPPSVFLPVKDMKPVDKRNYTPDMGLRGSYVENYDEIPTQGYAEYEFSGDVFFDSIGVVLKGLLGDETVTGTSPYTHVFSTLNSGQPPTFTLTDYNGFNARQYPGAAFSDLEIKFSADGLVEHTTKATTLPSSTTTKPTTAFSMVAPKAGYTGVVSIGGTSTGLVQDGSLKLTRKVTPIMAVNGSTSPYVIWASAVAYTGSLTVIYESDAFLTPMLAGTKQSLDVVFGSSPLSLELKSTSTLFLEAPIERSKDYVEQKITFEGVANTTDAGASGGYSPVKVTLLNAVTAAY